MLTALSAFFYRIASWQTLLLAILLYVPFPAYILKTLEERMNALAGRAIGPIDLLVGYQPDKILEMVKAYGPEGRAIYAQGELTSDLAYPLIYTFLFCVTLSMLFRNRPYAPFRFVNVMPVVTLVFDLLENACIVYLLKTYPDVSTGIASLCSVFSNLKWGFFAVTIVLIVYGLVRRLIHGPADRLPNYARK